MAYIKEHNILSSHGVSEKITWKTLLDICDEMNSKKENIIIKDVNIVCKNFLTKLFQKLNIFNFIDDLSNIVEQNSITYDKNLDKNELLKNLKITSSKRYTENKLSKIFPRFKKIKV